VLRTDALRGITVHEMTWLNPAPSKVLDASAIGDCLWLLRRSSGRSASGIVNLRSTAQGGD
jgi:hypothetical protein